jgi:DNA-binding transcriptional MerR regulator
MTEEKQVFSLDELCTLANTPKRTVRFYIQQQLVDRPIGEKRAAHYTPRHLEQLLSIRKWQDAGLSLDRISEILKEPESGDLPPPKRQVGVPEVWSHMVISDGLELHVNSSQVGLSPEALRQLLQEVMQSYERIIKENKNE